MIQLPRKLFYAIEAVLYIAYNASAEPASSKDIAARQGMPPRYLEQMMQKLVRSGILRGVRGPRGGYLLAREKRRITLAEICNALDEEGEMPASTPLGNQIVAPLLKGMYALIAEQLQAVTIAELYEQAHDRHIRKSGSEDNNFAI